MEKFEGMYYSDLLDLREALDSDLRSKCSLYNEISSDFDFNDHAIDYMTNKQTRLYLACLSLDAEILELEDKIFDVTQEIERRKQNDLIDYSPRELEMAGQLVLFEI